jgi:hypothetical protein
MKMLKFVTVSVLFTAAYVFLAAQARESRPAAAILRWQAPGWSMFREATYNPATEVLWIRFASGREYVYRGVPAACSTAFFESPEKGVFFNRNIRRCFASVRLDPSATNALAHAPRPS